MAEVATSTVKTAEGANESPSEVKGAAASAYSRLTTDRDPFLQRARRCSELTIPSLFRMSGANGADDTEVPWNTLGAYLVSNLAAKVILALFPAGRPPMKLAQDKKASRDIDAIEDAEQRANLKAQINTGLSRVEREFSDAMEEDGDRSRLNVAALKMIVGGNHGFQFYTDGTIRGIPLERFVTKRDPQGVLIEFVIEDPLSYATLPEDVKGMVTEKGYVCKDGDEDRSIINVYTHGYREDGRWEVYQEVFGCVVPDSTAYYIDEALPYLFAPWVLLDGEDYGRSYVELYEGDLQTVEGGTQTITEGSAAMARFLQFVHPGGLTSKKAVAEAGNGAVLTGRAEDVTTMVTGKTSDFSSQQWVMEQAMQRLSRAFLLNSAVQRGGERVTAEEIRFVAQELEDALGGVYSQQVVSFQTPYVTKKLRYLQRQGRVTPLPKGTVKVTIIAGLAALGRNAELNALDSFFSGAGELFGPQQLFQALGPNGIRNYLKRRAAALGIDTDGLLPGDEDAAKLDQQNTMQMMMEKLGPEALKQYGNNLTATQVADTNAQSRVDAAAQKALPAPSAETPQ